MSVREDLTQLRSTLSSLRGVLVAVLMGSAGVASAGFVTTYETQMEAIFSQTSFVTAANFTATGANPNVIDIRFNAMLSVVSPTLLSIDDDLKFGGPGTSLNSLSNQLGVPNFTVAMFFVDTITFCGGTGSNIIGCARNPGGLIALNSSAAAGPRGAALLAHELGHSLGLDHLVDNSNLMNSSITGNTGLNLAQASSILNSPIVRIDTGNGNQRYISITPIAVVAAIPEPQTWSMLVIGLLGVAVWARRRQACAG